ncbi:MAG: type II 3-dehydroquinate dehydratase [Acidimicrobiia bacterium]|nr:MAG: type II 3-dehydroquinate dehydratase [Acidimicrobiia bacterium]
MKVLVLNGPNLNLLGTRLPQVYGTATLGEVEDRCRRWGEELGIEVDAFQTNHEGALIDRIHDAIGRYDALVINPGALTHYSFALHDAIEAAALPTVEVHISDISQRENWRSVSVIAPACIATVAGMGIAGYRNALEILSGT